jgi:hypothetical protein
VPSSFVAHDRGKLVGCCAVQMASPASAARRFAMLYELAPGTYPPGAAWNSPPIIVGDLDSGQSVGCSMPRREGFAVYCMALHRGALTGESSELQY